MSACQKIMLTALMLYSTIAFSASAAPRPISPQSVHKLLSFLKQIQTARPAALRPMGKNLSPSQQPKLQTAIDAATLSILNNALTKAAASFIDYTKAQKIDGQDTVLAPYEIVAHFIGKCYEPFIVLSKKGISDLWSDYLAISGQFILGQNPELCDIFAGALRSIITLWKRYQEKFGNNEVKLQLQRGKSLEDVTKTVEKWIKLTQNIMEEMEKCGTAATAQQQLQKIPDAELAARDAILQERDQSIQKIIQERDKNIQDIKQKRLTIEQKQKEFIAKEAKAREQIVAEENAALAKLNKEQNDTAKKINKAVQERTTKEETITKLSELIATINEKISAANPLNQLAMGYIHAALESLLSPSPNKNVFLLSIKKAYIVLLNKTQSHINDEEPYLELSSKFDLTNDKADITLLKYDLITLWDLATIILFNNQENTDVDFLKAKPYQLPYYSIEQWKQLTETIGNEGLDVATMKTIDPTYKASAISKLRSKAKAIAQSDAAKKTAAAVGSAWQSLTSGLSKIKGYLAPTVVEIDEDVQSVEAEIAAALGRIPAAAIAKIPVSAKDVPAAVAAAAEPKEPAAVAAPAAEPKAAVIPAAKAG